MTLKKQSPAPKKWYKKKGIWISNFFFLVFFGIVLILIFHFLGFFQDNENKLSAPTPQKKL